MMQESRWTAEVAIMNKYFPQFAAFKTNNGSVGFFGQVRGLGEKPITTIEGLGIGSDGRLHPLQQAFLDLGALQCGYCTTGMIMAGVGLLAKDKSPSDQAVLKAMGAGKK